MRTREHGKFLAFPVSTLAAFLLCLQAVAQCPPNIDFEKGSFDNWTAYTGSVSAGTGQNVMSLNPTGAVYGGQHEIFSRATNAFDRDFFGDFPVVCPNGSGYSVKLGNTQGGAQAEGFFAEEIVPVVIKGKKGDSVIDQDEHLRPDTTLAALQKLKPVVKASGTVTANAANS